MMPFAKNLRRPALVAHRGGAAVAPENTIVAFQDARDVYGADQLEMDVRMSRDGVVFVLHDASVDRTTDGAGLLAEMTAAEIEQLDAGYRFTADGGRTFPYRGLGVKVPRFSQALAQVQLPAMVEIKSPTDDARRAVAEVIRDAGASDRLCIGAWQDAPAHKLATEMPDVALFFPEQAARAFVAAATTRTSPPDTPFHVLALPDDGRTSHLNWRDLRAAADEAGVIVQVWCVNDETSMRRWLNNGVDGVQTDRPDVLRKVMHGLTKRA